MDNVESLWLKINNKQKDQARQIIELKRYINQKNVQSVFINYSDDGFLTGYLHNEVKNISLNTLEPNYFHSFEPYNSIKMINKAQEYVNIRNYDLIHFDVLHKFNDLNLFLNRIEPLADKVIVLSRTETNKANTNAYLDYLSVNWDVVYDDKGYYGMRILTKK